MIKPQSERVDQRPYLSGQSGRGPGAVWAGQCHEGGRPALTHLALGVQWGQARLCLHPQGESPHLSVTCGLFARIACCILSAPAKILPLGSASVQERRPV